MLIKTLILLSFAAVLGGQSIDNVLTATNFKISDTVRGKEAEFDVTNTSQKSIAGFSVVLELRRGDKVLGAFNRTMAAAGSKRFKPGDTEHVKGFFLLGTEIPELKVITDYVLFDDGTSIGPDKHKRAGWINGVMIGSRSKDK